MVRYIRLSFTSERMNGNRSRNFSNESILLQNYKNKPVNLMTCSGSTNERCYQNFYIPKRLQAIDKFFLGEFTHCSSLHMPWHNQLKNQSKTTSVKFKMYINIRKLYKIHLIINIGIYVIIPWQYLEGQPAKWQKSHN